MHSLSSNRCFGPLRPFSLARRSLASLRSFFSWHYDGPTLPPTAVVTVIGAFFKKNQKMPLFPLTPVLSLH